MNSRIVIASIVGLAALGLGGLATSRKPAAPASSASPASTYRSEVAGAPAPPAQASPVAAVAAASAEPITIETAPQPGIDDTSAELAETSEIAQPEVDSDETAAAQGEVSVSAASNSHGVQTWTMAADDPRGAYVAKSNEGREVASVWVAGEPEEASQAPQDSWHVVVAIDGKEQKVTVRDSEDGTRPEVVEMPGLDPRYKEIVSNLFHSLAPDT